MSLVLHYYSEYKARFCLYAFPQILRRLRSLAFQQFLGCTAEYDLSAVRAALRSHVDDVVSLCDQFKPMLHNYDRVSARYELSQECKQLFNILAVKPRAGFIEDIDLTLALQMTCQLDTLYLAALKGACRLSECEIAKSHIYHAL